MLRPGGTAGLLGLVSPAAASWAKQVLRLLMQRGSGVEAKFMGLASLRSEGRVCQRLLEAQYRQQFLDPCGL